MTDQKKNGWTFRQIAPFYLVLGIVTLIKVFRDYTFLLMSPTDAHGTVQVEAIVAYAFVISSLVLVFESAKMIYRTIRRTH